MNIWLFAQVTQRLLAGHSCFSPKGIGASASQAREM